MGVKKLGLLVFLLFAALFGSCGEEKPPYDPNLIFDDEAPTYALEWSSLDLRWTVRSLEVGVCTGSRGIWVNHRGDFEVQPCSEDRKVQGTLSRADLIQLIRFADPVMRGERRGTWTCGDRSPGDEASRMTALRRGRGEPSLLYESSSARQRECRRGDLEQVGLLREYLETLADWYGAPS